MWAILYSTGCGRAYRGHKSFVMAQSANTGFQIVVEAVKIHEEAMRMAITAETVVYEQKQYSAKRCCESEQRRVYRDRKSVVEALKLKEQGGERNL